MMFWRLLRLLRFVRRFRAFTVASTVTSNVVCNVTRDTARNVTHAAHAVTSSVNRTTNTVSRIANSLFNLRKQVGRSLPRRLFVPAVSRLPPTHVHLPFVTGLSAVSICSRHTANTRSQLTASICSQLTA